MFNGTNVGNFERSDNFVFLNIRNPLFVFLYSCILVFLYSDFDVREVMAIFVDFCIEKM